MTSCQAIVMSDRRRRQGRRGSRGRRRSRRRRRSRGRRSSSSALAQLCGERVVCPQFRRQKVPLALAELTQLARLADVVARKESRGLRVPPTSLAEEQRSQGDAARARWGIHQHVSDADNSGGNLALELRASAPGVICQLQRRQPERPRVARLVQLVPIPRSPRPSHGVHITLSARSHEVKRASRGGLRLPERFGDVRQMRAHGGWAGGRAVLEADDLRVERRNQPASDRQGESHETASDRQGESHETGARGGAAQHRLAHRMIAADNCWQIS